MQNHTQKENKKKENLRGWGKVKNQNTSRDYKPYFRGFRKDNYKHTKRQGKVERERECV